MSSQRVRPGRVTVLRDLLLFLVGVGIVVQQTGFPWLLDSPEKVSIPALVVGALFCNGPVVLQALAIRFGGGTSSPGPSLGPPPSGSSSQPSAAPSSAGE